MAVVLLLSPGGAVVSVLHNVYGVQHTLVGFNPCAALSPPTHAHCRAAFRSVLSTAHVFLPMFHCATTLVKKLSIKQSWLDVHTNRKKTIFWYLS